MEVYIAEIRSMVEDGYTHAWIAGIQWGEVLKVESTL